MFGRATAVGAVALLQKSCDSFGLRFYVITSSFHSNAVKLFLTSRQLSF